jgi:TetR/AcrR family transcriptional repressor of nem operon
MARNREFNTEDVLDKATNLFWSKGFNGVSTQELIDEFGISKSSMYGTFGDKMKLFVATLERYSFQLTDNIKVRLQHATGLKKEVKALLRSICLGCLENGKGCFIVNSAIELAPHNKEIATITLNHRKRLESIFADAIKKGIESREIARHVKPKTVSRTICNTITGIQVDTKYIKNKKYFESVINSVIELLD